VHETTNPPESSEVRPWITNKQIRGEQCPNGMQFYALIMDDSDAPGGLWIHKVLSNIPASVNALPAGVEGHEQLANGIRQGRCLGIDHFSHHGYQEPQPPHGTPLAFPSGATKAAAARQTLDPYQLAKAKLTGLFQHRGGRLTTMTSSLRDSLQHISL
jgi:phosphatidylethanolamine-binding protein (PEBP) family uncharacterized protein